MDSLTYNISNTLINIVNENISKIRKELKKATNNTGTTAIYVACISYVITVFIELFKNKTVKSTVLGKNAETFTMISPFLVPLKPIIYTILCISVITAFIFPMINKSMTMPWIPIPVSEEEPQSINDLSSFDTTKFRGLIN